MLAENHIYFYNRIKLVLNQCKMAVSALKNPKTCHKSVSFMDVLQEFSVAESKQIGGDTYTDVSL